MEKPIIFNADDVRAIRNDAISLCAEYFNICKEIQRSTAIIKTQLCYDADQRGVLRHVQLALLATSSRDRVLADCDGCRVAFDEILRRKQLRRKLSAVKSKIRRLGEKADLYYYDYA